jgi:hypothetical protein
MPAFAHLGDTVNVLPRFPEAIPLSVPRTSALLLGYEVPGFVLEDVLQSSLLVGAEVPGKLFLNGASYYTHQPVRPPRMQAIICLDCCEHSSSGHSPHRSSGMISVLS